MITFHGKPILLTSATLSQNTTASSEKLGNSFPPIPCLHCLILQCIRISIIVQLYGLTTTISIVTQFYFYRKELLERAQTPCGLNIQIPFSSPWIHLKFRTYILFKLVFSCINSTIIYFLMPYLSQIISPWTMKFTTTILVVPRTFI